MSMKQVGVHTYLQFESSCNLISNTRAMNICMATCGNTITRLLVAGETTQDYETIDYAGEGPNA